MADHGSLNFNYIKFVVIITQSMITMLFKILIFRTVTENDSCTIHQKNIYHFFRVPICHHEMIEKRKKLKARQNEIRPLEKKRPRYLPKNRHQA